VANAAESKKTNAKVRQVNEPNHPGFVAGDKANSVGGHRESKDGSNPKGFMPRDAGDEDAHQTWP
jgi:hypothetical protein